MIKLNPLIGYGLFAFREIGPQIATVRLGSAHNDYLNVIFNFGFVGLFLYLGVIIDYIRKLLLVLFSAKRQYESEFIISLLYLIYFSIRGFSEANFATINFVLPLLIVLVSLLTCIGRKENLMSCCVNNNIKNIKEWI
jgi:O-antigen ligase